MAANSPFISPKGKSFKTVIIFSFVERIEKDLVGIIAASDHKTKGE